MTQEKQRAIDRQIAEQAAEWLATLADCGPEKRAQFAEWVAESPRNLREFLFMSTVDSELAQLDPQKHMRVPSLATKNNVIGLGAQSVPVFPRQSRVFPRSRFSRVEAIAAAIAALFVAIGCIWWAYSRNFDSPTYSTGIGEQRTVPLADGSVLQLNSRSSVGTALSAASRDMQLLEGEAMFKVASDPARPFRVHVSGVTIQAIGTQFNVNRRPSGTMISVVEGRVRIVGKEATVLGAGEEARIGRTGHLERRSAVEPGNISAWRQHRLVFRDDTLEDIVVEFNRYNLNAQIKVEDVAILARRYTAVFDADDPASLIAFLRQDSDLDVQSKDGTLIVRPR